MGDIVVVRLGSEPLVGMVLEDRGRLGPEGGQVYRVGWTPSLSEEPLEVEVSAGGLSLAIPRSEWTRALARIDEFSMRVSAVISSKGFADRLDNARLLLDQSIAAVLERGKPKDYELVHRRCVEDLGPAALRVRRSISEGGSGEVMPTLARLPALIEVEAEQDRQWLVAEGELEHWQGLIWGRLDDLRQTAPVDETRAGRILLSIVGDCADLAAWIRCTVGVGE